MDRLNARKLFRSLGRAFRNKRYELTGSGLYFPRDRLAFDNYFVFQFPNEEPSLAPNMVVTEGMEYMIGVALGATAQITTWYLAPYAGAVDPQLSWDASNFASSSTEFTNYSGNRKEWNETQSGTTIGNYSSLASFTVGAGAQDTVNGAGLLSSATQGGTAGTLFAAARDANGKTGLADGDTFTVGYQLTISNA